MRRFVVDTNILIHAMRDAEMGAELAAWQRLMAPRLYQHAVVISELLVGARNAEVWRRWHELWVQPAERVRRVLVPAYLTWLRASRIISDLYQLGHISAGGTKPGFFNDCLLAASACHNGFVLVTHNVSDFELIANVEPEFQVRRPFP